MGSMYVLYNLWLWKGTDCDVLCTCQLHVPPPIPPARFVIDRCVSCNSCELTHTTVTSLTDNLCQMNHHRVTKWHTLIHWVDYQANNWGEMTHTRVPSVTDNWGKVTHMWDTWNLSMTDDSPMTDRLISFKGFRSETEEIGVPAEPIRPEPSSCAPPPLTLLHHTHMRSREVQLWRNYSIDLSPKMSKMVTKLI